MATRFGRPGETPAATAGGDGGHAVPDVLRRWARTCVWLLPAWGLLLAGSTLTHQPDYETDFEGYADYVTTTPFLVSHLLASIGGAALGVIGAVALVALLAGTPAARTALWGLSAFSAAQVLTASVFGVAAFFQPAVGRAFSGGHDAAARSINEDVYGPEIFAVVGLGILLMIIGAALLARAARRSGLAPAWAAWLFALAVPVFALSGLMLEVFQPVAGLLVAVSAGVLARRASSD